ncbi:MAG: type II toxin-antitoxin system MqsA family antitoxin [Chloroflexi bacterium]|nr:type II toxin-antitoxin system MqsA family antitoxin [Chloroflexota bacterium]
MITCYFCKGRVEPRLVEFDARWGEKRAIIRDVPAEVCAQCGEQYFAPEVSCRLEELVRQEDNFSEPFLLVPLRAYREGARA